MNSAKHISNQTINNDSRKKSGAPVQNQKKIFVISGIVAVIVLFLVIMVCWENLHPRLIFKINDKKVYLSDMMVDIYMNESTGECINRITVQITGHWKMMTE